MFARFRKKASENQEIPEEVAVASPEGETDNVDSVAEIEKARQDLMRAAMEAITMPAAETESSVSESSGEEDIPVIQVRINRPEPPTSEVESEPETPAESAAPSPQKKPIAPAESPPAPGEPVFLEKKEPETTEAVTAPEKSPEVVPVRSEPMVVEPEERPDTKETPDRESAPERIPEVDPELQEVEDQEYFPEDKIIAEIFPETELLSSRLMAFAEAENEVAPVGIPPGDIPLESPASEIPPASVSFPARPSEQPADTSIAQLDDIMIDIVKQDIASHRRRISRSN